MLKVAVFGGAFDPITKSHMRVAKELLNLFDEVWLMPCYVSYYDKEMASANDRLYMCNVTVENSNIRNIKVCPFEIVGKLKGQTYEIMDMFLKYHKDKNPHIKFYFVIGGDNANKIVTWDGWEELTKLLPFVVVPRSGYDMDPKIDWYLKRPHIYLKDFEPDTVSSTQVRNSIKQNKFSDMIDGDILKYILQNGLYA